MLTVSAAGDSAIPMNVTRGMELRPEIKGRSSRNETGRDYLSFLQGVAGLNSWHCFLFGLECVDDNEW